MTWIALSLTAGVLALSVWAVLTNAHAKTLESRVELLSRELESLRLVAKAHHRALAGINRVITGDVTKGGE